MLFQRLDDSVAFAPEERQLIGAVRKLARDEIAPRAAARAVPGVLVSPLWLSAVYLIHTWAELCLSPVGLSSMTKLAPPRIVSLMMGVWFLGASVGNFLGGQAASFYESMRAPQFIVELGPAAVELMDRTMIGLARSNPAFLPVLDQCVHGDPEAVLLVSETNPLER